MTTRRDAIALATGSAVALAAARLRRDVPVAARELAENELHASLTEARRRAREAALAAGDLSTPESRKATWAAVKAAMAAATERAIERKIAQ